MPSFLLEVFTDPIWTEMAKNAPALLVALGLGIPMFKFQRDEIKALRESLAQERKEYIDSLSKRDDKIFEIATNTQKALQDITSLMGQMETRNSMMDSDLKSQMTHAVGVLNKLSTILETTMKFIEKRG